MPLLGCSACGLVLERGQAVDEGHLAAEPCPDCRQQLRAVGVAEATQLIRERELAARWRALAAERRRERAEERG
jgi:hypothetical protein